MSAPLQGIRVVDFSPLLPGPFASRILADLGAEVTRIESPARPDLVQHMPPFVQGVSVLHAYLNRNKQTIVLDLKSADGIAAVQHLLSEADVLIEQFRPGVMDRLGLGFAALASRYPLLIYCSISGYGQDGPCRERAGHDINYQALAGLAGSSGRAAGGPPPLSFQPADVAGGSLHAVIGILAALRQRDLDGCGQHLDISMADCAFHLNPLAAAVAVVGEHETLAEGALLNGGSHYDYYRTADDRWLAVGSLEPAFIETLGQVIGVPDLPTQLRTAPATAKALLADILATRDLAAWRDVFSQVDACVEPVLTVREAVASPLAAARGWAVDVPLPNGGTIRQPALPIKFSRYAPVYGMAAGEAPTASTSLG